MSCLSPWQLNANNFPEAENLLISPSGWLRHLKFENTAEVTFCQFGSCLNWIRICTCFLMHNRRIPKIEVWKPQPQTLFKYWQSVEMCDGLLAECANSTRMTKPTDKVTTQSWDEKFKSKPKLLKLEYRKSNSRDQNTGSKIKAQIRKEELHMWPCIWPFRCQPGSFENCNLPNTFSPQKIYKCR